MRIDNVIRISLMFSSMIAFLFLVIYFLGLNFFIFLMLISIIAGAFTLTGYWYTDKITYHEETANLIYKRL